MGSVMRSFGQFLAMIAMVASAVNAQCALSCFAQASPSPATIHAAAHHSNPAHSCCSHGKSSDRKERKNEQPCPTSLPGVSANVVITAAQQTGTLHFENAAFGAHATMVVLPLRWQLATVFNDSPGLHHPPAFSVLRI